MQRVFGRLTSHWEAWVGGLLLALTLGAALLGPLLAPYPFDAIRPTDSFRPPSPQHLFGTDDLGRDLCSRVLVGARISLAVGLASGFVGVRCGSEATAHTTIRRNSVILFGRRAWADRHHWVVCSRAPTPDQAAAPPPPTR